VQGRVRAGIFKHQQGLGGQEWKAVREGWGSKGKQGRKCGHHPNVANEIVHDNTWPKCCLVCKQALDRCKKNCHWCRLTQRHLLRVVRPSVLWQGRSLLGLSTL